jgi:glycosyltransferase involved in cell wall biosynthesis
MSESTALSVIIPLFNDLDGLSAVLPPLVQELKGLGADFEILIVDDGSEPPVDPQSLSLHPVRLLRHRQNRGYGAALKTAIRAAQAPFILVLDADGQHDPADIPRFFSAIQDLDMVVGTRTNLEQAPLWRRPGKFVLSLLFRFLTGVHTGDFNCGYRCMRTSAIRRIMHLCSDKFSFSMSSTILAISNHYDVAFLPVAMRPRVGRSSVTVRTGFETILLLIRMVVLTNPLRFFLPVSAVFILAGTLLAIPYLWQHRGVSVGSLLLMLTGILTFFFGVLTDITSEALKHLNDTE